MSRDLKSTQPLYLIEWSPTVTIDTPALMIADGDDLTMVLISEQDNTPTDAGFIVNTEGRPSNAALTQGQLNALKDPFGDGDVGFTAEFDPATGLIIGGSFNAGKPGSTEMAAPGGGAVTGAAGGEGGAAQGDPGAAGQGAFTLYRMSPTIRDFNGDNHGGLEGHCECGDPSADHYPFDTACLRKQWLYAYHYPTNVCPAGGYAGVEVSLGLALEDAKKFTITINNIAGTTYLWKENDTIANVTVAFGTNQVWTGSRERIDMTDRCGGFWGDGPPIDITAEDDGCGCDDGCASGGCSRNDGPDLGSLKFRLSLGQSGYQQSGGFLWFKTETLPAAITPELFDVTALPSVSVVSNNNALSCVDNVAVNGRHIDVSAITGGVRFDIYRYDISANTYVEGSWEITKSGDTVTFIGKDSSNNTLRNLTYGKTGVRHCKPVLL